MVGISIALCLINTSFATSKWPLPMDIKQIGNAPAACLPKDDKESIEVKAAYVYESYAPVETQTRWLIEMKPSTKPLVLHPGECLAYGKNIDGYTSTVPPQSLASDKPFVFNIVRSDQDKKWASRFYDAIFCGLTMPDGRIVFRKFIRKDGSTPPDICAYVASQLLNDPSSNITQRDNTFRYRRPTPSRVETIPRWTGRMLLDNRLHQPIIMGYLAGVADAGQGRIWCDKGAVKTGEIDAAILDGLRKLPSVELEKNGAILINDFLKNKYPCLR